MYNRQSVVFGLAITVIGIAALSGLALTEDDSPLTKQQVLDLLPTGIDMLDTTATGNYQKLVAAGARAHPALAELLKETDNPIVIGRIFAIFAESVGDKTFELSAITNVIERYRGQSTSEARKVRIYAVQTIGRIGSAANLAILKEMLQDSDERVRINAVRAVAGANNEEALAILENFVEFRKAGVTEEELARDSSIHEGEAAAESLKRTLCTPE